MTAVEFSILLSIIVIAVAFITFEEILDCMDDDEEVEVEEDVEEHSP